MNEAEMTINDRLFCIALLEGSNVDEATKILTKTQRKKKTRGNRCKNGPNRVRTDTAEIYRKMRTKLLISSSTRTTVENTIWETGFKTKKEEGVTDRRKEDLISEEDGGGCFRCGPLNHWMRESKTKHGTKKGNGRRGEQTYRGNSGYGSRFHQSF